MSGLSRILDAGASFQAVTGSSPVAPSRLYTPEEVADLLKGKDDAIAILTQELEDARIAAGLDDMTALHNKAYFIAEGHKYFSRALNPHGRAAPNESLGVAFLDFNRFKDVNTILGHVKADEVMRYVAAEVQNITERAEDVYARYGGDEFVVLLPGASEDFLKEFKTRFDEINEKMECTLKDGTVVKPRLSCGVSSYDHHESFEELVEDANQAMYFDKTAKAENGIISTFELPEKNSRASKHPAPEAALI